MAVFFYGCITLDGYLATKEHGLNWLYDTGSPEETSCDEFYSHMDVVLMGRQTFEEICVHPQGACLSRLYRSQWQSCGICKRAGK